MARRGVKTWILAVLTFAVGGCSYSPGMGSDRIAGDWSPTGATGEAEGAVPEPKVIPITAGLTKTLRQ